MRMVVVLDKGWNVRNYDRQQVQSQKIERSCRAVNISEQILNISPKEKEGEHVETEMRPAVVNESGSDHTKEFLVLCHGKWVEHEAVLKLWISPPCHADRHCDSD